MSRFIELNAISKQFEDIRIVFVNTEKIVSFHTQEKQGKKYTLLNFDNTFFFVKETLEEICRMLLISKECNHD